MTGVVGVDIGTSTLKVSTRDVNTGGIVTERVGGTPSSPFAILRAVERLIALTRADVIGISSLRRALVVDDGELVLARSSPAQPFVRPDTVGLVDAANPLAPIHRWVQSVARRTQRFVTLDSWLAEQLTGRSVYAESQAWLTGAWDTSRGEWDEATCADAHLTPEDLPEVLSSPRVVDGICLPVIGDHEATALACASSGEWPLRVVECGTALACMFGGFQDPPAGLGLESPVRCGYEELIDPHFLSRVGGVSSAAPHWMNSSELPSAADVVLAAVARHSGPSGRILLCGGSATPQFRQELHARGLDVVMGDACTSSAGALLVAERAEVRASN